MEIRFDNKTVVITGSARGIGYACAEKFIESGAKVAIVDILEDNIKEAVDSLSRKGIVKGYRLDLCKVSEMPAVVARIREELGEIDVLVQAAGVLGSNAGEKVTEAQWDSTMDVNGKGTFFMMQTVANQSMIPNKAGSIINFSSIAGLRGMAEPLNSAFYCASKAAVALITKQAAVEWGKYNIRVNAVAPGGVKTGFLKDAPEEVIENAVKMIPLKKLSEPEDIANGICFLASDAAAMVTGHVLVIDGGGFAVGF